MDTYEVIYIDGTTNIIVSSEQYVKNNTCIKSYKKIKTIDKKNESFMNIELLAKENKLLKAQLQAQTERSDFIEDCIAEMAGVVYNTEETTT